MLALRRRIAYRLRLIGSRLEEMAQDWLPRRDLQWFGFEDNDHHVSSCSILFESPLHVPPIQFFSLAKEAGPGLQILDLWRLKASQDRN